MKSDYGETGKDDNSVDVLDDMNDPLNPGVSQCAGFSDAVVCRHNTMSQSADCNDTKIPSTS